MWYDFKIFNIAPIAVLIDKLIDFLMFLYLIS